MNWDLIIKNIMDQLCSELLQEKETYFSSAGRPDENWKPLTRGTIRTKKWREKTGHNLGGTATSFNLATGKLRDSIQVTWEFIPNGIRIKSWSTDDVWLINYLTKTLGRDFLEFNEQDLEKVKERLKVLFIENMQK